MKRTIFTTAIFALLLLCGGVARGQNDTLPHITIGNIIISESNDSIVGECISGHVSYDALTKVLTLSNASISEDVSFWRSSVKIKLTGTNYIQSMMIVSDSCSFVGPGSLCVGSSSEETAIDAPRTAYLGLKQQAVLNITAINVGISCIYDHIGDNNPIYPLFDIDSSTLIITAPTCCFLIPWWKLTSCYLVEPSELQYDAEAYMFMQNGAPILSIYDYLEIQPAAVGIHEIIQPECSVFGTVGGIRIGKLSKSQTVEIVNLAGQRVYIGKTNDSGLFIPLESGVYVVRVGHISNKVIVK